MSASIFVTGTGTDIGKTHILAALLAEAAACGRAPLALKPVLSGYDADAPETSDSARLLTALGQQADADSIAGITPWRMRAPLSPDIAAAREGVTLKLADIRDFCTDALARSDGRAFIEGAGGVMSPIASDGLNLDLITSLGAQPLLVCGAYLGAISHTLTACAAMRAASAPPSLIVINPQGADADSTASVAAALERFGAGAPVVVWSPAAAPAILEALEV